MPPPAPGAHSNWLDAVVGWGADVDVDVGAGGGGGDDWAPHCPCASPTSSYAN